MELVSEPVAVLSEGMAELLNRVVDEESECELCEHLREFRRSWALTVCTSFPDSGEAARGSLRRLPVVFVVALRVLLCTPSSATL